MTSVRKRVVQPGTVVPSEARDLGVNQLSTQRSLAALGMTGIVDRASQHDCQNLMESSDWIQLHEEPIDIGPVVDFVSADAAGGIGIFLGTTREEIDAQGRKLIALDYE